MKKIFRFYSNFEVFSSINYIESKKYDLINKLLYFSFNYIQAFMVLRSLENCKFLSNKTFFFILKETFRTSFKTDL